MTFFALDTRKLFFYHKFYGQTLVLQNWRNYKLIWCGHIY